MTNLERSLELILERNRRVEAEKAWEVSFTRRAFLALLTYLTAVLLLWLIGEERFLLLSLIPTISYVFSTLTLPWLKRFWITATSKNHRQ